MNIQYVNNDIIGKGDFTHITGNVFVEFSTERICIISEDQAQVVLITPRYAS